VINKSRELRVAYQLAIGMPVSEGEIARLKKVCDGQNLLDLISNGWYCAGRRCDIPKDALYVGHYRDVYAWVDRSGLQAFGDFTNAVIAIADTSIEGQKAYAGAVAGGPLLTLPIGPR
jgi:hypothetical protein